MRSAYRRLDGVSRVRLKRNTFGQVQLGGQRRVYHHLLSVCRLLHHSAMVDEETGHTAFRDFRRDKATMWRLFEDFVTGFYEREQRAYVVNPGGRRRIDWTGTDATDAANRARIPVMEADVILESPERRIILDTKFYRDALAADAAPGHGSSAAGGDPAPASCTPTTSTNCSRTCGTARPTGRTGRGTRGSCCIRRWARSR